MSSAMPNARRALRADMVEVLFMRRDITLCVNNLDCGKKNKLAADVPG
jgi:hypothetical protein